MNNVEYGSEAPAEPQPQASQPSKVTRFSHLPAPTLLLAILDMSSTVDIASSFIEGAPPGELTDVVNDVKALTSDNDPALISKLKPAFQKYNEEQLTAVKLPGSSQPVLVSTYNKLADGRYYDAESNTSFEFDHITQKASSTQSYTHDSPNSSLVSSLLKSLATHFSEHYPISSASAYTVCSSESSSIALLLVSNKYSPTNFWNGRWRATYLYDPSSSSLTGTIKVNVHYYEDGNVALATTKKINIDNTGSTGVDVVRKIALAEKTYQEELNRAFVGMNEQSFKGLRRQLPVTRQKVEWDKVGGYRLGSDLRGGAGR